MKIKNLNVVHHQKFFFERKWMNMIFFFSSQKIYLLLLICLYKSHCIPSNEILAVVCMFLVIYSSYFFVLIIHDIRYEYFYLCSLFLYFNYCCWNLFNYEIKINNLFCYFVVYIFYEKNTYRNLCIDHVIWAKLIILEAYVWSD